MTLHQKAITAALIFVRYHIDTVDTWRTYMTEVHRIYKNL